MNDLNQLGKIKGIYDLQPGHQYLILVDGKHFSHEGAYALFKDLEEQGIEFSLYVVGTLHPKSVEVHKLDD